MRMFDLINEKNGLQVRLTEAIRLMAKYGKAYAEAESNYKIALAQTALKLKDSGMAVTMLNLVIYGTNPVPALRLKRDTAEVMYKTAQENIQSIKLQLRLVEAQIEREWGQKNGA